jgi:hypothetical protein
MKVEELILELLKLPKDAKICIFDARKSLHNADDEPNSIGLFTEFSIERINTDKPFFGLIFENDDYMEDGTPDYGSPIVNAVLKENFKDDEYAEDFKIIKEEIKTTRYFFLSSMGKNPNRSLSYNNFTISTEEGYPSYDKCIQLSQEKFPNLNDVVLLSISELSEEDFNIFISESEL